MCYHIAWARRLTPLGGGDRITRPKEYEGWVRRQFTAIAPTTWGSNLRDMPIVK